MCECRYHQQKSKEAELYDFYSIHGDILVVTSKPELITSMTVHGTVIVAPTVEGVSRLLSQVNHYRKEGK